MKHGMASRVTLEEQMAAYKQVAPLVQQHSHLRHSMIDWGLLMMPLNQYPPQQQHAENPQLGAVSCPMYRKGVIKVSYVSFCSCSCCCCVLQECDALMEVQVAARVARIKEVELATARQEAAAK